MLILWRIVMNRNTVLMALATLGLVLGSSTARSAQYTIDSVHSDVSFTIKHLVVSKTRGSFTKFSGEFSYDDKDASTWNANAVIEAASINTANEMRDNHLRGAEFFEVEKYPTLTFKSTKITDVKADSAKMEGWLSMHGIEKPVVLDLKIGGVIKDPMGEIRAGFEASTVINRKDFGITYNKMLDSGGMALGEEVEISIHIEGVQKKEVVENAVAKPAVKDKKVPAKK